MVNTQNPAIARATVEISSVLDDTSDLCSLPSALEHTIKKYCHIDWMAVFNWSTLNQQTNITTNPHLPFNWDELYQEVAPYDVFRQRGESESEGRVLIYHEFADLTREEERFSMEFIKKHTDTTQFLGFKGFSSASATTAYGFYRCDETHRFGMEDRAFFEGVNPVLISYAKTIELYQKYNYQRTVLEYLLADEVIRPLVFSETLHPLEITTETLAALADAYGVAHLTSLPSDIARWINGTIAPEGRIFPNTGPFYLRLNLPKGVLTCRAYIIRTPERRCLLLIKFKLHEVRVSFSILKERGLTPREIAALEYLPLGYANHQIAAAMGVREVSVKKHLKNAARKLEAANRTEMLFQALLEKSILQHTELQAL